MPTVVKCPTCSSSVTWSEESQFRPFCSKRCQLIDLGEWSFENNKISTPWQRLQEDRDLLSLLKNDSPATASAIGNAVYYGTISLLLTEGDKRNSPTLLERAEQLYSEGPPDLLTRLRSGDNNLPNYRSIQRRALPSDIRALDNALKKLKAPSDNTDQINATAFERLTRVAPRIRDIPWTSATEVANTTNR